MRTIPTIDPIFREAADVWIGSSAPWAEVGYKVFTLGDSVEFTPMGNTDGFIDGIDLLNKGLAEG
jgi:hypothetical protein